MPKKDHILNLPGFSIKKITGYPHPLMIDVVYRRKARCPQCHSKQVRKKASFIRHVRHESLGHRMVTLRFKAYKLYCHSCRRYFNQQFPGIGKYQRASERLHQQVFHQHTEGMSQQSLARQLKKGKATIERWYHRAYQRAYQEIARPHCPAVLGIDEHFFSQRQGYATTLCDLRKHKIFDIVKGHCANTLADYLKQLPGKERVKVICIDLSHRYRRLIQHYFPNALIVADRFHVVRLVNHLSLKAYHQLDPNLKYQRGILNVLRRREDRLNHQQQQKRDAYLKQQPAIAAVYQFKQRLHRLLLKKHCKARVCKRLLPVFLNKLKQLKQSGFKSLKTLGNTLYQWREEVVRMWRFTKNNGITEGFHRKMKLIQRRAYGFRNFENYRLRVKVLCS